MENVLYMAGSNSTDSINGKILNHIRQEKGGKMGELINWEDFPLPVYNIQLEQEEGVPSQALELSLKIDKAEALIISVAEHNGSITAFFKNVLDWLSRTGDDYRVFKGKPVLLLSVSPGARGGQNALEHAAFIIERLGGEVRAKMSFPDFHDNTFQREGKLEIRHAKLKESLIGIVGDFQRGLVHSEKAC